MFNGNTTSDTLFLPLAGSHLNKTNHQLATEVAARNRSIKVIRIQCAHQQKCQNNRMLYEAEGKKSRRKVHIKAKQNMAKTTN